MRALRNALLAAVPIIMMMARSAFASTPVSTPDAPASAPDAPASAPEKTSAPGETPPPAAKEEAPAPKGSLMTMAPLGKGRIGISVGGGVAVLLPFYAVEVGVGLGRVDLYGRMESVIGVLHYPSLGVRWSPLDIRSWKVGLELAVNYSFFGIATDQVNLTSTFYMSAQVGISGPVTKSTDLVFAFGNEIDFFDYKSLDGEGNFDANVHYDTAIFVLGLKTRLTEDLDGYLRGRVRVPVETLRYEATGLYVVPFVEIGGTFSF
jgi:hypothetical protein